MELDFKNSIWQLTEPGQSAMGRADVIRKFARDYGWRPSDEIVSYPGTEGYANGHLLVEHGLANTAVISFLHTTQPFLSLSTPDQNRLLSISYNNLVDWHLFPDRNGVSVVFNRASPWKPHYVATADNPDALRAESFEIVSGRRPNPNLPALDDALIRTVSFWRRVLASDLGLTNETTAIAELFNAIFFVRALEDHQRNHTPNFQHGLIEPLETANKPIKLRTLIKEALDRFGTPNASYSLFDYDQLKQFDRLDPETTKQLLTNFYQNKFAPFSYDFSLISKHALSRIYEHYISALKEPNTTEQYLFAKHLPDEYSKKMSGGVTCPHFLYQGL